jgi:hypothetical protein
MRDREHADVSRAGQSLASCFLTTMSALPPPLPPTTPIRKTIVPDPFSATSTLTPLSSMGDSRAKSSSPSVLSRPRTSSPEDGDGSPTPPRRVSQRPKRSTRFDALLTPQKALPAKMKLVSNPDAATGKAGGLGRNGLRRKRKRQATSDDEGSELEVWRREDFGRSLLCAFAPSYVERGT